MDKELERMLRTMFGDMIYLCRNKKLDAKLVEAMVPSDVGFGNVFLVLAPNDKEAREKYVELMHSRIICDVNDVEVKAVPEVDGKVIEVEW